MKCYEITFRTFYDALRHQWRMYVLIVLLFAALGVASGAIWAQRLSAPAAGEADSIGRVDFSPLSFDPEYYASCYLELQTAKEKTETYIQTLSAESTLTEAQQAQVAEFAAAFDEYVREQFLPLQDVFTNAPAANYTPAEFLIPYIWTTGQTDAAEQSRHTGALIDAAAVAQNQLAERLDALAGEIAVENHLLVRVSADPVSVLIYHTHRAVSARENFLVLTLFCTLTGVCAGAYLCLCREAKNRLAQAKPENT